MLPAQPSAGTSRFIPLGGDGKFSPSACYQCDLRVAGDAGGGFARCTLTLDVRFTNLIAYICGTVAGAATAPDFAMQIFEGSPSTDVAFVEVVGTSPHVAATVNTNNATFLWYPPPLFMKQSGHIQVTWPNVDGDTFGITAEIFVFNPEIRQITPVPALMWNVPGVSAPAAV